MPSRSPEDRSPEDRAAADHSPDDRAPEAGAPEAGAPEAGAAGAGAPADREGLPDIDGLQVGQALRLRRSHACGANEWTVQRVGADIGLRCTGCGRRVLLSRQQLRQRLLGVVRAAPGGPAEADRAAASRRALEE